MAVSVFFMYLTGNTYWAIILDTVEKGRIGGVGGFVHLIANLAGIVAPAVDRLHGAGHRRQLRQRVRV